jgi:hypothetical protein
MRASAGLYLKPAVILDSPDRLPHLRRHGATRPRPSDTSAALDDSTAPRVRPTENVKGRLAPERAESGASC